jgi:amino-acid N-acetyltransferase
LLVVEADHRGRTELLLMGAVIRQANEADVSAIEELLRDNALPLDGIRDRLGTTLVAADDARIIGTAALEVFDDGALLRSVAVAASRRSSGAGGRLVQALLGLAFERDLGAVYLLTTTAEGYFPRFGFQRVSREVVPPGVRQSVEFTSACPASAAVMRRDL